MKFAAGRCVALMLALALAGCGPRASDMQLYLPGVAKTNTLYRAVALGQVTGGETSYTVDAGGEFQEALRRTLDGASMLAAGGAAAHYRLDVALDFSHSGTPAGHYEVDADFTYRLYDLAAGAAALETKVRSVESAQGDPGETARFIFFGNLGSPADRALSPNERWRYAYAAAARENIRDAVDKLAAWGAAKP